MFDTVVFKEEKDNGWHKENNESCGCARGRRLLSSDINFFRREVSVEDIAVGVLFLASDETRNITATLLPITAGLDKNILAPEPYFTI